MAISGSAAIGVWILNAYSVKKNSNNFISNRFEFDILPYPYVKYSLPINLK
jgi:hypothetical protein